MKVIQYIMSTVTDPCKQELQVLMSTPQQEQQNVVSVATAAGRRAH